MKLSYKRHAILPILSAVFLLGVTALSSYFVINQGTGGFKSRAEGKCTVDDCSTYRVDSNGPEGAFEECRQKGSAICMVDSNKKCVAKSLYRKSGGSNNAYYACEINANCSQTLQCAAGLKCDSGTNKCVIATTRTTTSTTPTCGTANRSCCPPAGHVGRYYCQSGLYASSQIAGCTCSSTRPPAVSTTLTTTASRTSRTSTGGGVSGASCSGGTLCNASPENVGNYTGSSGELVCGSDFTQYMCSSTGAWVHGPTPGPCECPYSLPEAPPAEEPPAVDPPVESSATVGDATLVFALKFQGVNGNPRGGKTVPFKVKLKGPTKTTDYVSGNLTADSTGKWTGSVAFSGIELGPDTKYTIYIKAGKHLQKRVCDSTPTESSGGQYNRSESEIILTSGTNNLDFSGILQLVGDLPSETGEQDGVVDSYEVSYVLGHLRSTQPDELAIADLNFDGIIDTQDRSLIIQSLNVKYDDE